MGVVSLATPTLGGGCTTHISVWAYGVSWRVNPPLFSLFRRSARGLTHYDAFWRRAFEPRNSADFGPSWAAWIALLLAELEIGTSSIYTIVSVSRVQIGSDGLTASPREPLIHQPLTLSRCLHTCVPYCRWRPRIGPRNHTPGESTPVAPLYRLPPSPSLPFYTKTHIIKLGN